MADFGALERAIITGNAKEAEALTRDALDEGVEVGMILENHLIPAMDEVGAKFECNEYFVPELLIGARAMKAAMALIKPLLVEQGARPVGRIAIGTVKGDLHDIGKNLVASMLEGGGFEVVDLGVDVAPEDFIRAVEERGVDIIALSALLTTTMPAMKETVERVREAGYDGRVKVMIGGAPITQAYADEIGADGFSDNASAAVAMARSLIGAS